MLSIEGLELGYGGSVVLRGIDLKVEPGQVVCLMGRNGVGKTTLFKGLMGLMKPLNGKITFDGQDLTKTAPDVRARAGIGYVPQGREIFPQLSVEENLALGLEATRGRNGRKGAETKVPDSVFEMFPMLGKMLHRKGGTLSGGQQQQLAIGRALASGPKLLLLDEPMEGIQPSVVMEIEGVIEKLKRERTTAVLLIEQSLEFAVNIADYSYILDRHRIVAEGAPSELSMDTVRKHLAV